MKSIKKYMELLDKRVTVFCTDGSFITGLWSDWTSEADNEPDGESITLDTSDGSLVEVYVSDIERIDGMKV